MARWLDDDEAGQTIPVEQLSALARAWWGDRLAKNWRPRIRAQSQAILDGVGLTGDFWELP